MARYLLVWFCLILFGLDALPASAEKRVALVIGIDTYDNLDPSVQLKKARTDAAAVGPTFKELGFDVIAQTDLTRSAFNIVWIEFLSKLEPDDTAAFYFAGHGVELGGRNYLIPKDVPDASNAALVWRSAKRQPEACGRCHGDPAQTLPPRTRFAVEACSRRALKPSGAAIC